MNQSPTSPTLVVLSAGMGSRYGGLKQMDPVEPGGETVLDYSVFDALRAGFGKIVFVIRRDFAEVFRERVGRRFETHAEIRYVFQELTRLPGNRPVPGGRVKPWGTGHAVWCAATEVAEPFAVINADDFYGAESFQALGRFLVSVDANANPAPCFMVGFRLANTLSEHGTVSRGICAVDEASRLVSVQECTAIERTPSGARQILSDGSAWDFTGEEIVSMNCWGFTPRIFAGLEKQLDAFLKFHGDTPKSEFYLPSAVAEMIGRREATVQVLPTRAAWFGVTYQEDRPRVAAALQSLVRAGAYPGQLWAGTAGAMVHASTL